MAKFSSLKTSEEAQPMQLLNPATGRPLVGERADGTKVEATIWLHSQDHPSAKAHDRKVADARGKTRARPTLEDVEKEMIEKLAVLTIKWDIVGLDGEIIDEPCTRENAIELYTALPWVYEQVLDFTRSRAHYVKTP